MTVDDPWATDRTPPPATPLSEYERALEAAGYGDTARARYFAERGGESREYLECVWDEEIVPAAEAAGIIPPRPVVEDELEDVIHRWCHRAAIRQRDDVRGNPSPWETPLTREELDKTDALAARLVAERGDALAEFLQANSRPRWVKNNPAAQAAAAEFERQVFALLAQEPTTVVICGSTRFMAEMTEANLQETAAGRIVLALGCNLKEPHPLWADPADAEALKPKLDALHRAKIRKADEVLVVGNYIGDSTRAEIAYAHELGKTVRYTHPEIEETIK